MTIDEELKQASRGIIDAVSGSTPAMRARTVPILVPLLLLLLLLLLVTGGAVAAFAVGRGANQPVEVTAASPGPDVPGSSPSTEPPPTSMPDTAPETTSPTASATTCDVPRPASPTSGPINSVFFTCERTLTFPLNPAFRVVPDGPLADRQRAAVVAHLEGPTSEERAGGLSSPFTAERTGGTLRSFEVRSGVASIDFDERLVDAIPTPESRQQAVTELVNTVFDYSNVESIRFLVEGDGAAWCQALPDACGAIDRSVAMLEPGQCTGAALDGRHCTEP